MFLAKLVQAILKIGAVVKGVAPLLKAAAPKAGEVIDRVESEFTALVKIVLQAEIAGQALTLTGPDKLKIAAPQVAKALIFVDAFKGRKIKKPELVMAAAEKIAAGINDYMKALDDDIEVDNVAA